MKLPLILSTLLTCTLIAASYTNPESYIWGTNPSPALCQVNVIFCSTRPENYVVSIKNDGSSWYHIDVSGRNNNGELETFEDNVDASKYSYTNDYLLTNGALSGITLDVKGYK